MAALSVFPQNTVSTVTIQVSGSGVKEIQVDGVPFPFDDTYSTVTGRRTITIPELSTGQHTLKVIRVNQNNVRRENSKVFNIRSGYDLNILVRSNGSVTLTEKVRAVGSASGQTPMSDANFNTLYRNIQGTWQPRARITALRNAFTIRNNFFTTTQARQLILLASSEDDRFDLSKLAVHRITDPANFSQLYTVLNSQNNRNALASYIRTNVGYAYPDNQNRTPMSDVTFNALYADVQNEYSTASKVTMLNSAFSNMNNYFTSSQVKQLILLVPGESNRLHLAKTAYRGITDRSNFHIVYDLFVSQASRNELASYISNNYGDNTRYARTPMTDTEYRELYSKVQNTWGIGAKMNSLTNIFMNDSYYFTTAQAEDLIRLISSESNRLELAKSAYDNITDPQNFTNLYDMFSSQSRKDELTAWVRNYTYSNTTADVNPAYKTPMPDAEYNSMYSRVRNTWGFGAKMGALSDIFANDSYFFTSVQAKELISLVSSETNRLELAKASYDNITDPSNFLPRMYEILSKQSSESELAAYVNMYIQ